MRFNIIKKVLCLSLALTMLCPALISCGKNDKKATLLSFSQAQSVEAMKEYDGKTVTMIGYMSTLSPINGEFMYLMNLPYQSCPFCIPNTTQLSNTMAVYAKANRSFEFTDRAIQVVGTLEFGDWEDEFGYKYNYRIKDAEYTIVDTSDMSEQLRLWQALASTDAIADVYAMYEYINFLCFWGTYTAEFTSGKDYLHPQDALDFIKKDGWQFNYGYADGYFDSIIKKIESVDKDKFGALVTNVREAEKFANRVLGELEGGKYQKVSEYSNSFKDGRIQYKMNNADEFEAKMKELYGGFSSWISEWEL